MSRFSTTCALAIAAIAAACGGAAAQPGAQSGVLECRGAPSVGFVVGSEQRLECIFRSEYGPIYPYYGAVHHLGLDLGFTAQSLLTWAVFSPTLHVGPTDLAGRYGGVTAGATVGVGATANALVGGSAQSFTLQPLSLEGQTGLNVTAGIAELDLVPAEHPFPPEAFHHAHRRVHHATVHHHHVHRHSDRG
jgi:hypothetical protein